MNILHDRILNQISNLLISLALKLKLVNYRVRFHLILRLQLRGVRVLETGNALVLF